MVSEGDDEVPVDQFAVSRLERHNGRQKLPLCHVLLGFN